ncbi:tetratricopeptide (TPR) repeat protein [Sphingopyxis sp. OAS728]|uniref:tetratricopeptide repeat-containing sulfotransferase family protein n=1 Tax=Sphingopyxis sp. OAS728 TaxID=2663823 RepID=UPI00178B4C05|nr:sulfotransferase [Sphingopyxis sp. OAS728]MBE1529554.1 tetratricopeptide (TPR) repeat protein [Sphingopyxis sp. OAS728]
MEHLDEEQRLRDAIAADPDSARAHAALVFHLCNAARADEALLHLDREARRRPSNIWPLSLRAGVLSAERRASEAIDVHRRLVAMAPHIAILWCNFANDLAAAGFTSEAASAYRNAVERAPELGGAWLGIANLRGDAFSAADIAVMKRAIGMVADPYQCVQIFFALGRALGEQRDFRRSFENFSQANTLREKLVPHDAARLAAFVEAHRNMRPTLFEARKSSLSQECGPIFIVGMPRSGSTLVEQILASHPDVEGLGELSALEEVAASIGAFDAPDDFFSRLQTLTRAEAMDLATVYLARAGRYRRTGRPFFTDKMPSNWRFIALILRILPGARIIDVRRDAMACCFSAYTTYFNRNTDFPNGLEDLGRYYRAYRGMMESAQASVPERMFDIDYDRLVDDPDREIGALLDSLDLPFATSCLAPHRNRRAVFTPSAQQVRAPINRMKESSSDYLAWLEPLKAALGAE